MQRLLRQSFFQTFLGLFAVAAFIQMAVTRGVLSPLLIAPASVSALCSDISVGYFSSWIFNILVVACPAFAKRRRMKAWLAIRYVEFKDSLVRIYLGTIGESYDPEVVIELRDSGKFSDYFSARYSSDQTRWHAVHNGLYEWGLADIQFRCRLFISDYDLTIGLLGDLEFRLMKKYGNVREMLARVEILKAEYDDIKSLMNLLFSIHCPWSFLDGKPYKDAIEENISGI